MPVAIGMDIGQAHDHSILVVWSQDTDKTPAFVRYVRAIPLNTPFQEQQAIARYIVTQFNSDIFVLDNTGDDEDRGRRTGNGVWTQTPLPWKPGCTLRVRIDLAGPDAVDSE